MSEAITTLSATELAQRIQRRELSAREVVAAHIARIEQVNPQINAVTVPLFDQAMSAAQAADEHQAQGQTLAPLHGLPITIKDCFHVAGTPSTMGLSTLATQPVTTDGELVARLKAAGAIMLGKTNVPQLMLLHETDNPVYGRTNNPWDLQRTPGGSSGGEAAIVAAGGSPWGLANDLGGSIRLPAHFCGLTGLRPSSQRITRRGSVKNLRGLEALQSQPGPLARSVADVELMLNILAGDAANSIEHDVVPVKMRPSSAVDMTKLRIAYWEDNGYFPYSPAVKRAVREAVAILQEQGAKVEAIAPPKIGEAMYLYTAILSADGGADARRLLQGSKIDHRIRKLLLAGKLPNVLRPLAATFYEWMHAKHQAGLVRAARRRTADDVWQLTHRLSEYRQAFLADIMSRFDALVLPPYALVAPKHEQAMEVIAAAGDCFLINLLGLPSGVVPVTNVRAGEESDRPASREWAERVASECEQGSAGLPVGVQIAANFWREDCVLAVMSAIEQGVQQRGSFSRQAAFRLH